MCAWSHLELLSGIMTGLQLSQMLYSLLSTLDNLAVHTMDWLCTAHISPPGPSLWLHTQIQDDLPNINAEFTEKTSSCIQVNMVYA